MAIIGPKDLPTILQVNSTEMKKYVLGQFGWPTVEVELTEDQLETCLRVTGDFIATYFPNEQRLAVFTTEPLKSTYPMPADAYAVQEVSWDGGSTSFHDVFSADYYIMNIGLLNNTSTLLLDYHMLQSYRKFSQKILGTEGHWEVINEVDGDTTQQLIRLYPTPKGAFPVVVLYHPIISHFRSPTAKLLVNKMLVAEAKGILGMVRRKISGFPSPGGTITLDGESLVAESKEEKKDIVDEAIKLGEPMPIGLW